MIFRIKFILILVGVISISSCEDVINIETDDAPDILVVDAWLNDQIDDQNIKLTFSQPYFDSNPARPVLGAIISVTGNNNVYEFEDQDDGNYKWSPSNGISLGKVGDEFALKIEFDGKTYVAYSRMNRTPIIDEISQELREGELGPDGIYTQFFARDFEGRGDTYWVKTFKNGKFLGKPSEINIAYDAAFDAGSEIDGIIFIPPIREFTNPFEDVETGETIPSPWSAGDLVRVEIHSISFEAFSFIELARDQILNGDNTIFASPIANTSGNILGNTEEAVLGIFNVASISSLEKTIE